MGPLDLDSIELPDNHPFAVKKSLDPGQLSVLPCVLPHPGTPLTAPAPLLLVWLCQGRHRSAPHSALPALQKLQPGRLQLRGMAGECWLSVITTCWP